MTKLSQEFIENTARSLVDNPDAVRVESSHDEQGVLLTLFVDPADMGKVIGKQGSISISLRTILRCIGFKENARVSLKIAEPTGSTH